MPLMLAGCSGQVTSGPTYYETESVGDPQSGFPNPTERALFMAANRTRSDPATVKGPSSTIYPAVAPLMLDFDLERSSRFHAVMLATGHAPLMHDSPCVLAADVGTSSCDGTPACGCQGGMTCNSCSNCPAGTGPFDRIGRFYTGGGYEGEIIAAGYSDPWSTMDGFVDEAAGADGHRQIITGSHYTVAGFGHSASPQGACWPTFDAGDFGGASVGSALIASASPKPIAGPAGSFRIYATWADPQGGAPAQLRAVVDGACYDLGRELGDPKLNSTWYVDLPLAAGCHSVYILGESAGGASALYPGSTAFTIPVGGVSGCPESVPQPGAGCSVVTPQDMSAPVDLGAVADLSTPPDLSQMPPPPPPPPPTVTLLSPSDGASFNGGATVRVQATASAASGHSIAGVLLHWTRNGTTTTYGLGATSAGHYALALVLARGQSTRSLYVSATDDAGRSSSTPSITINVK
jgi:hypothetical protein